MRYRVKFKKIFDNRLYTVYKKIDPIPPLRPFRFPGSLSRVLLIPHKGIPLDGEPKSEFEKLSKQKN